jgi:hypothetical protein
VVLIATSSSSSSLVDLATVDRHAAAAAAAAAVLSQLHMSDEGETFHVDMNAVTIVALATQVGPCMPPDSVVSVFLFACSNLTLTL